MDVKTMQQILSKDYGINSEKELFDAIKNSDGIDLGIFTVKIEREDDDKK